MAGGLVSQQKIIDEHKNAAEGDVAENKNIII